MQVNLETMEMFSPGQGRVRRTHHEGVFFRFCLSEKDYSFYGKIGNIQVSVMLTECVGIENLHSSSYLFSVWFRLFKRAHRNSHPD